MTTLERVRSHRPPAALHHAAPCGLRQRIERPLPVVGPDNADAFRAQLARCALECLELELLPVHQQRHAYEVQVRAVVRANARYGRRWGLVRVWLWLTGRRPAGFRVHGWWS